MKRADKTLTELYSAFVAERPEESRASCSDMDRENGRHVARLAARGVTTIPELIAALAECDALICADGGAMPLGAGLGLPIVCLFGNSGAQRWRPWAVPYRLLQKPSLDVSDIGVNAAATTIIKKTKS